MGINTNSVLESKLQTSATLRETASTKLKPVSSQIKFPVGYYKIHPDVGLNFQLNRFSDGSEVMIGAMKKIAPKIKDYRDYVRELSALSREAYKEGRILHGALYLRSAEFYMFPGDPAKAAARKQFVSSMRDVYGITANQCDEIPYEAGKLFTYRFTPRNPKSTIVIFGGFDSDIEEFIPMFLFFRDAGYDVVAFEGPGQGASLEETHLPLTGDWHRPVSNVLDHFQLKDVTLMGISLGGGLVVRAAAFEPRVKRIICDDIMVDGLAVFLRMLPTVKRAALKALLCARAAKLVNPLVQAAMGENLMIEWGVKQGMLVTGTSSPYDFFRAGMRFETKSISHLITQDVFLMAGAEDHYIPFVQLALQNRLLTKARSITSRVFTRQEQAHEHCQVGNMGLSVDVIVRWLNGLETRDQALIPNTL